MSRVRVKICGLTRPGQARCIAGLGVDAIGVVLANSPRQVSIERATEIAAAVGPLVTVVGVFVNAEAATISATARQVPLHHVQLHGDEPPELVDALDVAVIKAFRVRDERWLASVRRWMDGVANPSRVVGILLDAYSPDAYGGTGESFNWAWVADARSRGSLDCLPPLILSGGLRPENVAAAVAATGCRAVDVSSGVERLPGDKDVDAVARLVEQLAG